MASNVAVAKSRAAGKNARQSRQPMGSSKRKKAVAVAATIGKKAKQRCLRTVNRKANDDAPKASAKTSAPAPRRIPIPMAANAETKSRINPNGARTIHTAKANSRPVIFNMIPDKVTALV